MGKVCKIFTSTEDFRVNQETVCRNVAKCLCCKGYQDTLEMDTFYTQGQCAGMRRYIGVIRNIEEWKVADMRKRLFMVVTKLADGSM
eukprot:10025976-Heterocapsa_arctica.AAC.1